MAAAGPPGPENAAAAGHPAGINPRWILMMPPGVEVSRIKHAEDIMYDRLSELVGESIDGNRPVETYERLPNWYVLAQRDQWPIETTIRCASCTLTFSGFVWFVPLAEEEIEVGDGVTSLAFRRGQVVCSPNCAATFIETYYRGEQAAQLKELLVHLYYAITGQRVIHIYPAPRHTELQAYGGEMSDIEFWKRMAELSEQTSINVRKFTFPLLSADDIHGADGWGAARAAAPPPPPPPPDAQLGQGREENDRYSIDELSHMWPSLGVAPPAARPAALQVALPGPPAAAPAPPPAAPPAAQLAAIPAPYRDPNPPAAPKPAAPSEPQCWNLNHHPHGACPQTGHASAPANKVPSRPPAGLDELTWALIGNPM